MNLPNSDQLIVEHKKIVDYLLNPVHPYGAAKGRFFRAFGFRIEDWEILAEALRQHGREHDVVRTTGDWIWAAL